MFLLNWLFCHLAASEWGQRAFLKQMSVWKRCVFQKGKLRTTNDDYLWKITCCWFPKRRVRVCRDFRGLLRRSCCRLCRGCRWAPGRVVRLAAKVLSLQFGVRLESLQNSGLALLHRRHKQSAELMTRGMRDEDARRNRRKRSDTLGWCCVELEPDFTITLYCWNVCVVNTYDSRFYIQWNRYNWFSDLWFKPLNHNWKTGLLTVFFLTAQIKSLNSGPDRWKKSIF